MAVWRGAAEILDRAPFLHCLAAAQQSVLGSETQRGQTSGWGGTWKQVITEANANKCVQASQEKFHRARGGHKGEPGSVGAGPGAAALKKSRLTHQCVTDSSHGFPGPWGSLKRKAARPPDSWKIVFMSSCLPLHGD